MYNFVPSISDAFLKNLITEIDDDTIRGMVLGGSLRAAILLLIAT